MLGSLSFLPRLSPVFLYSNKVGLIQIQDYRKRSVLMRKVIDRIWNSLEMKVGAASGSPLLQTAVDEVGNLLHLDRCSFLWYYPHTQRVQLVYEQVRGNQEPMQWAYDGLEMFRSAASVLAQGQLVVSSGTEPRTGAFGAISRSLTQLPIFQHQKNKLQHSRTEVISGPGVQPDIAKLLVPVCRSSAEETSLQESRIGLMACLRSRPRNWSPDEIEIAQLVAQQLDIGIRQTKLYEQSQKQAQREKLINQITSQTRQSLDLETILTSAIAQLLDALEVDRCLVHLVEDCREQDLGSKGECSISSKSQIFWETAHRTAYRRQHLYEVCREPFPRTIDDFDTHGPITQWVIKYRQTVIIPDITQDPRIGAQNEEYKKAQINSSLVVPVQANNVLHAILYLNQCAYNRYWSKNDRELAEAVGNQLAISIQQACLYAQTRASMERESLLRLISDQIRGTLDLKTILQTAVREVQSLLKTDRAAIYQFTEDSQGEVVVEQTTGKCVSIMGEMSQRSCFVTKSAYQYLGERVQAINDVFNADLDDGNIALLQELQVRATLVVPIPKTEELGELLSEKEGENLHPNSPSRSVWGLLIVHECERPRVWQESEVELLQQLAIQVAIAIQQAELYEQARTSATAAQTKAEALEKAIYDLQQTQAQLIQTEKMSSLGQLVAGVAHEINNPVNFIYGNLTYANRYTQDLLKLVSLYQELYPEPSPEILECADDIDLEFLIEDFPKILSSMEVGADRIRQIVLSLRNFSRLDQAEMKPVDIHEGIDNTLLILQNRLKTNGGRTQVEIIKEYGDLPLVECYAGQLNQVFMNLLSNAIDAVEEFAVNGNATETPQIRIRTEMLQPDLITVRIADNGPGMTNSVRMRLFDAFFTTKPVGRGTGLGLSISYQIVVEKHKGAFWCESEPGKGAEFFLEIPVRPYDRP
ncbi:GAF domain-containing protein [Argonema antarcticum]|uniref:GAF domain-containing protein n=1 Tax=Argonema antarcticum TaxID=2942763 RepID=UPI00201290A4|nr:GAF domain-containing protein [Argonema antarcticum]MCL1469469.1 GAF domain-containing protein [Argonema antarcticum A004/B2]